jgi:acyl-lipid omega-6 desaturase (Delta-12 desaturase)
MASGRTGTRSAKPQWFGQLATFGRADLRKSITQIFTTLVPYVALLALMFLTIRQGLPYVLTLGLGVVAAGFLVRTFILFHDCCHGSFFASRRANRILGTITGILTFTPYEEWRLAHSRHHATAGDLDNRGHGDVYTMTVEEYRDAPLWMQVGYRLFRHPLVMLGFGPVWVFLLSQRITPRGAGKGARISTWVTNAALLAIAVAATLTIGLRTYVLIQLPVILMAAAAGIWLFYVQHNFEGVYWARHEEWDSLRAAMEGSSYYKLPKVLQWFTGSIGLHHIHHLRATIPNYHLQPAYDAIPEVQTVRPLTLRRSLKSLSLRLYDEEAGKMVGFRAARRGAKPESDIRSNS